MAILEVAQLEKSFGGTKVLRDISFSLEEGQALSIIGSSGSGKTTLLRCLNFLETPDSGRIAVRGRNLLDAEPVPSRSGGGTGCTSGWCFRTSICFPQYTALENVTLARRAAGQVRENRRKPRRPSAGRAKPCWSRWVWEIGWDTIPTSSPADSSSGWPLPVRWP